MNRKNGSSYRRREPKTGRGRGGIWTRTSFRTKVFETFASTSSATRPKNQQRLFIIGGYYPYLLSTKCRTRLIHRSPSVWQYAGLFRFAVEFHQQVQDILRLMVICCEDACTLKVFHQVLHGSYFKFLFKDFRCCIHICYVFIFWYVWLGRDSNPHARNGQQILSLSCLPIPPPSQTIKSARRGSNPHALSGTCS